MLLIIHLVHGIAVFSLSGGRKMGSSVVGQHCFVPDYVGSILTIVLVVDWQKDSMKADDCFLPCWLLLWTRWRRT